MVQMPAAVKLEAEEEQLEPLTGKRRRDSSPPLQDGRSSGRWGLGQLCPSPQDEPSPLGLQLRKTPSLLDLIQMRLSQGGDGSRKTGGGASAAGDKIKASNFPATLLKIGTWEWTSKNEGDLVAKCYFAKHKLVWEILNGSLKNKIEIQWSDITALKASCSECGPGTLDLALVRQPLFFKETNPQPKKHTLWQATSDFTCGQASIHRRHFLQCAPGLLNKHLQKLLRSDPRLHALSRQPEFVLDSPYFERTSSIFEDQNLEVAECSKHDELKCVHGPDFSNSCNASSACSALSFSPMNDQREDPTNRTEIPSRPGPNTSTSEESMRLKRPRESGSLDNATGSLDNATVQPSVSTTDVVNHIGSYFFRKTVAGEHFLPGNFPMGEDMLEQISQYLIEDSRVSSASDDKSSIMNRVNSFCCLLQNPTSIPSLQMHSIDEPEDDDHTVSKPPESSRGMTPTFELSVIDDVEESKPVPLPAISRKESVGELLFHLPHVESLPLILFNKSDHC